MDEEEEIFLLQEEKGGKNKIGESRLHEVARSDDYQELKNLINRGYDVNQRDNGGWTPLSEAVSHQKLSNVRLLLLKGAKVNVKSIECLTDDDGEKITSSGLTPLMESCINGNVDIIKLLLQYRADVLMRDDDDWTAIDHLRECLYYSKGMDEKIKEKLDQLIRRMDELHRKSGFEPRTLSEFNELLELKRIRRQKAISSSAAASQSDVGDSSLADKGPLISLGAADADGGIETTLTASSRKRKTVVSISSDSEDEEELQEFEETRNLNQYRSAIDGLRRNHKKKPSSSAKPASVPTRKKSLLIAKRMFFNT